MNGPKAAGDFRGDIEGLRAVAALSILVFHANSGSMPGGFIGVDLFFVISGYLITSSIWREIETKSFSLATFYARRIRRLYPALLATIVLTMAAGYFFLFPRELRDVARSAFATVFYVSNYFFASRIDYFSDDQVQPLLHTWSLAVEEQFYLIYPLFLLVLTAGKPSGGKRRLIGPLLALAVASLVLAEVMMRTNSTVAFYSSPTRFWELAVGGLIAVLPPIALPRAVREALSVACLVTIAAALMYFSEATPVPGLAALPPVLGIALLIKAGEEPTLVARSLAVPPLRFIGRISYSLYLVHWPLIVMLQANNLSMSHRHATTLAIVASVLLAWALYAFVETPTRRVPIRGYRWKISLAGAAGTAGVAALAAFVLLTGGFRDRIPPRSREMMSFLDYNARPVYRAGSCLMNAETEREGAKFDATTCIGRMSPSAPRVLLIGDSHAAQYYQALRENFPGIQLAQVTATGCRPLLRPTGSERCAALMNRAYHRLVENRLFDKIIIAGRWHMEDMKDLYETAAFASTHASRVYVMGPIIEYRVPLPRLLAFSYLDGKFDEQDGDECVDRARRSTRARFLDERMTSLLRPLAPNVRYISVLHAMCKGDDCETLTQSGEPVQFDYGHLTYEGSVELIRELKSEGDLSGLTVPHMAANQKVSVLLP